MVKRQVLFPPLEIANGSRGEEVTFVAANNLVELSATASDVKKALPPQALYYSQSFLEVSVVTSP